MMILPKEAWLSALAADPRPALLASEESYARFVALTEVLGLPEDNPTACSVRREVVADPGVVALVSRLPDWESGFSFGGHNAPAFPPNLLRLLHGLGVRAGDFPQIDATLDKMLRHQAGDGRLLTPGGTTGGKDPLLWTSLPCDHFAILEVLLLYGRHAGPGISRALARIGDTLTDTAQGPGWKCVPDPVAKWRGPGRKNDACLMMTVQALRLFALVPSAVRPPQLTGAARTLLQAWRNRQIEKPYMFGHGRRFVAGKWPPTWYDASAVLEAISDYRQVWSGPAAAPADTLSASELALALARNFDRDGLVTPRSCYQGFEEYSFGQKKRPSPWATARLCGVLREYDSLFAHAAGESPP